MKGNYGGMQLFEQYPILWVLLLGVILVSIAGPFLLKQRKRRETQMARIRTLQEQKNRLIAANGSETYYGEVDAYLRALDPHEELPQRAEIARLTHIAHMIDTVFHYNSVDWFAAHASDADYEDIVAGLRELSLKDMVHPVYDASEYRRWIDKVTTQEETDALFETSDAIRADFDRRGGAARVREAVYARLAPLMKDILAA